MTTPVFFLADVRDEYKLSKKMAGIDVVFHSAAFKHVSLCEHSPFDAVQTNIIGVQNVIQAACANQVQRVIFTSSDKAVNPTNVMGTSKLMGERLMSAANSNLRHSGPRSASPPPSSRTSLSRTPIRESGIHLPGRRILPPPGRLRLRN